MPNRDRKKPPSPVAGALPDDCRILLQHVRRCHAGSARSQAQGRRGQLRHRRETQTRIPGPADQPFQMVSAPMESVPFSFLRIAVFSSSSSLDPWKESSPENLFLSFKYAEWLPSFRLSIIICVLSKIPLQAMSRSSSFIARNFFQSRSGKLLMNFFFFEF